MVDGKNWREISLPIQFKVITLMAKSSAPKQIEEEMGRYLNEIPCYTGHRG